MGILVILMDNHRQDGIDGEWIEKTWFVWQLSSEPDKQNNLYQVHTGITQLQDM